MEVRDYLTRSLPDFAAVLIDFSYHQVMNLLLWILLGFIINLFLNKQDPFTEKNNWIGAGIIIALRSISGGIVSNFVFSAGIGSIDPLTFTYLGILPVLFLLIGPKSANYLNQRQL
jgi:hypothetical protein